MVSRATADPAGMEIVRGTPRRPITGCGRGFFGVLERLNEELLGWTDSGLGDGTAGHQHLAIEARAPVRRTTRMIEPAHCQQPWNDHGISEDQVRKAEEPELKYLEAQALGAELTRGQVKPLGKDAQKALDAVRGRVQQRRLATQNQYASMQQRDMLTYTDVPQSRESREFQPSLPPYRAHGSTGPQGTTGFTPTPLSRKRLNDESDDQDDAYGQGRRVRPKTHVAYPEAHVESAASANERIYGAGGAVPRRHVHPAQYIRASRTAKSVGSSQPLMAINNMVGGMPSINTQNPPQQSNYLPDGILPKTEHPPAHSAHPSIQLVHARSKVQSWADRSSFAVHKAFNSHPSGYQRNQTPPLELTEPYLPPYQSMASRNHTEMAGNPARAPATLAFMPSFQPTQGTTTNVPNPKKRRRTAEDSTEDTPVDEDDNQPANKWQARRQKLESQGFELPKDTDKPMGKVLQDSAGNDYIMLDGRQEYTAYHHDRRMSLLACENAKGRYRKWKSLPRIFTERFTVDADRNQNILWTVAKLSTTKPRSTQTMPVSIWRIGMRGQMCCFRLVKHVLTSAFYVPSICRTSRWLHDVDLTMIIVEWAQERSTSSSRVYAGPIRREIAAIEGPSAHLRLAPAPQGTQQQGLRSAPDVLLPAEPAYQA